MSRISRTQKRAAWGADIRIAALEDDADTNDDRYDAIEKKLDGLNRVLVGILITLATASILLAINVVVLRS